MTALHLVDQPWPHAVYRFYDRTGALLYVGCTYHPHNRVLQHRSRSVWYSAVDPARTTIAWYPSKGAAETAETAAIASEHPVHNLRLYPGFTRGHMLTGGQS